MNINLQWSTEFLGAIWFDDRLQLNSYSISMQLLTNSESPAVTNVAIERIKAFILLELSNAVFMWTSMVTVCLWDLEVDSRFWEC